MSHGFCVFCAKFKELRKSHKKTGICSSCLNDKNAEKVFDQVFTMEALKLD